MRKPLNLTSRLHPKGKVWLRQAQAPVAWSAMLQGTREGHASPALWASAWEAGFSGQVQERGEHGPAPLGAWLHPQGCWDTPLFRDKSSRASDGVHILWPRISRKIVINFISCPIQLESIYGLLYMRLCFELGIKQKTGGQIDLEALEQWFPNLATHRNHLGSFKIFQRPGYTRCHLKQKKSGGRPTHYYF